VCFGQAFKFCFVGQDARDIAYGCVVARALVSQRTKNVYVSHLLQFGHERAKNCSHRGLFLVVVSCSPVILAVQAQVHESSIGAEKLVEESSIRAEKAS
jgi:hypothetical protein